MLEIKLKLSVGCLGLLVGLGASPAAAQSTRTVQLVYARGAGAEQCPDADAIRSGVAARLGYEPFDKRAPTALSASVLRVGRRLEARIEMRDAAGNVQAERTLSSQHSDCSELASALELAISIAIDPMSASRPAPPSRAAAPPPSTPAPVPAPLAEPEPDRTQSPPVTPTSLQAGVGMIGTFGSAPGPALGVTLKVGARRRAVSLSVEGRADLPASKSLSMGEVSASLLVGSLVPCLHRGGLAVCGLITAGALRGGGEGLVNEQPVTAPFFALGLRGIAEIHLGGALFGSLHADLLAPLVQTTLRVSGQEVWTSPAVSGVIGIGVGAHFE